MLEANPKKEWQPPFPRAKNGLKKSLLMALPFFGLFDTETYAFAFGALNRTLSSVFPTFASFCFAFPIVDFSGGHSSMSSLLNAKNGYSVGRVDRVPKVQKKTTSTFQRNDDRLCLTELGMNECPRSPTKAPRTILARWWYGMSQRGGGGPTKSFTQKQPFLMLLVLRSKYYLDDSLVRLTAASLKYKNPKCSLKSAMVQW